MENNLCEDYVTEKLFRTMGTRVQALPIAMGKADYAKFVPPHSILNVMDYKSPKVSDKHIEYTIGTWLSPFSSFRKADCAM